jgi:hypothetical protein
MGKPIVFFSRCRPQEVDGIEVVLDARMVFIGHPMARENSKYNPKNLKACIVDPSCSEDEWYEAHSRSTKKRQFNQNRNLIEKVVPGSIAMVPRPSRGLIYCGRVKSGFELVDCPEWYEKYMMIRGDVDSDETWHAADVAQGWTVDEFRSIPLPRIPAWIRRSLFGRSTYGVVKPDEIAGDPLPVISDAMEADGFETQDWTLDPIDVEKRLMSHISPSAFEHLVVSLLQLENRHEVWSQVGGSGDGGIDGVGAGKDGRVTGLLQCKWQYWGGDTFPLDPVWVRGTHGIRKYLAVLRHEVSTPPHDCTFLDRKIIADLVIKHHTMLPEAIAMKIGIG